MLIDRLNHTAKVILFIIETPPYRESVSVVLKLGSVLSKFLKDK